MRRPPHRRARDQREGPQTTSAQRLGRAADTVHNALVQSVGPGPAAPPVMRVFPAWPREWDAAFTLLCRGGFLVTSSMRDGEVEFVAVASPQGGVCRLRNPWGAEEVRVRRNGDPQPHLSGDLLRVTTAPSDQMLFLRPGTNTDDITRTVPAGDR